MENVVIWEDTTDILDLFLIKLLFTLPSLFY